MSEPVRKELACEPGAVSYLEWESARAPLHFAHATGFNAETYRALLSPLATRLHIFAADLRGHGFTTLPTAPGMARGWDIYRDDLTKILDRLHGEPIVLAGHSMGATTSMMVAAAHPTRVRALVLVEPVLVPRLAMVMGRIMRMAGGASPGPNLAELAAKRRDIFPSSDATLASYRGRGAFKTWPEEFLRDYLAGGLVPTGNGTEMRLGCAPQWEAQTFMATPPGIAAVARQVKCPITILHAEGGTAQQNEIAVITRAHPNTRVIKVPGATHFLPMERPHIVQEELERAAKL